MPKNYKIIGWFIIFLHLVGAIGSIIPDTRELMISLTPINLIITGFLLIYTHAGSSRKLFTFFALSFLIGFSIEIIGVKTGFPFGDYSYGQTLGWKLFDVPILIGVNWFVLAYIFGMLLKISKLKPFIKVLVAAIGMVCLDVLIEPIAIQLDYWDWAGSIPISNFIGWFGTALIIQFGFSKIEFEKYNPLVLFVLIAQTTYFSLIFLHEKYF